MVGEQPGADHRVFCRGLSSERAVGGLDFTHDGEAMSTSTWTRSSPPSASSATRCRSRSRASARSHPSPQTGRSATASSPSARSRGNGRGTIPDQRTDARTLAATIAAEVAAGSISTGAAGVDPHENATDFNGWRRIDLKERLGAGAGRCRAKIRTRSELLDAARDASLDEQITVASGSAAKELAPGVPVTILFGTESGNAELVAEELGTFLGERSDLEISDLATISPGDLDPERFYLLVSSTMGR